MAGIEDDSSEDLDDQELEKDLLRDSSEEEDYEGWLDHQLKFKQHERQRQDLKGQDALGPLDGAAAAAWNSLKESAAWADSATTVLTRELHLAEADFTASAQGLGQELSAPRHELGNELLIGAECAGGTPSQSIEGATGSAPHYKCPIDQERVVSGRELRRVTEGQDVRDSAQKKARARREDANAAEAALAARLREEMDLEVQRQAVEIEEQRRASHDRSRFVALTMAAVGLQAVARKLTAKRSFVEAVRSTVRIQAAARRRAGVVYAARARALREVEAAAVEAAAAAAAAVEAAAVEAAVAEAEAQREAQAVADQKRQAEAAEAARAAAAAAQAVAEVKLKRAAAIAAWWAAEPERDESAAAMGTAMASLQTMTLERRREALGFSALQQRRVIAGTGENGHASLGCGLELRRSLDGPSSAFALFGSDFPEAAASLLPEFCQSAVKPSCTAHNGPTRGGSSALSAADERNEEDPRALLRRQLAEAEERRQILLADALAPCLPGVSDDESTDTVDAAVQARALRPYHGPTRVARAESAASEVAVHESTVVIATMEAEATAATMQAAAGSARMASLLFAPGSSNDHGGNPIADAISSLGFGDLSKVVSLELDVESLSGGLGCLSAMAPRLASLSLNVNRFGDNLEGSGLLAIRGSVPLVALRLKDNGIRAWPSGAGSSLGESGTLAELSLDVNRLESLDAKGLNPLGPSLIRLGLAANQIRDWPSEASDPLLFLPRLQRIEAYHNKLVGLPRGAFRGLPSLTHLDLGRNQLQNTADLGRTLSEASSLAVLVLSQNSLKAPPAPLRLPLLRKLWLGSNRISSLSPWVDWSSPSSSTLESAEVRVESASAATWLPSLEWLHLDHNSISSIPSGCLAGCPLLRHLDLSHNALRGAAYPPGASSAQGLPAPASGSYAAPEVAPTFVPFASLAGLVFPQGSAARLVSLLVRDNPLSSTEITISAAAIEVGTRPAAGEPERPGVIFPPPDDGENREGDAGTALPQPALAAPHAPMQVPWESSLIAWLSVVLPSLVLVDGHPVGPAKRRLAHFNRLEAPGLCHLFGSLHHVAALGFLRRLVRSHRPCPQIFLGQNATPVWSAEALAPNVLLHCSQPGAHVGNIADARTIEMVRSEERPASGRWRTHRRSHTTGQLSAVAILPCEAAASTDMALWETRRWTCAVCGGPVRPLPGISGVRTTWRQCGYCRTAHSLPPPPPQLRWEVINRPAAEAFQVSNYGGLEWAILESRRAAEALRKRHRDEDDADAPEVEPASTKWELPGGIGLFPVEGWWPGACCSDLTSAAQAAAWRALRRRARQSAEESAAAVEGLRAQCFETKTGLRWASLCLSPETETRGVRGVHNAAARIVSAAGKMRVAAEIAAHEALVASVWFAAGEAAAAVTTMQRVWRGARARAVWFGPGVFGRAARMSKAEASKADARLASEARSAAASVLQAVVRGRAVRQRIVTAMASAAWNDPEVEDLLRGGLDDDLASFVAGLTAMDRASFPELLERGSVAEEDFRAYDDLGLSASRPVSASGISEVDSDVSGHWQIDHPSRDGLLQKGTSHYLEPLFGHRPAVAERKHVVPSLSPAARATLPALMPTVPGSQHPQDDRSSVAAMACEAMDAARVAPGGGALKSGRDKKSRAEEVPPTRFNTSSVGRMDNGDVPRIPQSSQGGGWGGGATVFRDRARHKQKTQKKKPAWATPVLKND